MKSSQVSAGDDDGTVDQTKPAFVRYKSSIYVDAFNLALDTVLDEESHLFDEKEMDVFRQWRELDYEAQYLWVSPLPKDVETLTYHCYLDMFGCS
jgi:Fanconi-associated nuclease 1